MPKWRTRIKQGISATTNVSGDHIMLVERRPAKGWYTRYQRDEYLKLQGPFTVKYWGYTWPTRVVSQPAVATIQSQKAEAIATKKFYTKLKAINQDMQGLVFLGELRETLRMLRNPAAAFRKAAERDYFEALRRHKKRNRRQWSENVDQRKWLDAVAGSWLEFQFGVQPLVSDMQGAYDALDRLNWDPIHRKLIHATGKDMEADGVPTLGEWNTTAQLSFTSETVKTKHKKVIYRALWERTRDVPVNLSTGKRLADSFGLELREFVPTLWELMPWSFLIDYFTNIGDILEQAFASTSDIRWVNKTVLYEHEVLIQTKFWESKVIANNSGGQYPDKYIACDPNRQEAFSRYRRRYFTRAASPVPNVAKLQWELPGSRFKQANMAALATLFSKDLFPQRVTRKHTR